MPNRPGNAVPTAPRGNANNGMNNANPPRNDVNNGRGNAAPSAPKGDTNNGMGNAGQPSGNDRSNRGTSFGGRSQSNMQSSSRVNSFPSTSGTSRTRSNLFLYVL